MSEDSNKFKVILDGIDISERVSSVRVKGEIGTVKYYSIRLTDGSVELVDSLRCDVTSLKDSK